MKVTRILNKIDRLFHPSNVFALQPDHDLLRENRTYTEANDIVLLSYPRSGNTWLRRLLANSILDAQQQPDSLRSDIPFETVVPSIYTQSIKRPCLHHYEEICQRIVKSHEHRDAKRHKTVYLFRNPVDTLVSWHHFVSNSPSLLNQFPEVTDLSIDEFCLKAVDGWAKHIQKTRQYKHLLLVQYESLFQNPQKVLTDILDFCKIPQKNINLKQVIENQSIRKLKPITQSQELRKGGVGHGECELRPDTVAQLRQYQNSLDITWKAEMDQQLTLV